MIQMLSVDEILKHVPSIFEGDRDKPWMMWNQQLGNQWGFHCGFSVSDDHLSSYPAFLTWLRSVNGSGGGIHQGCNEDPCMYIMDFTVPIEFIRTPTPTEIVLKKLNKDEIALLREYFQNETAP
jgi:hypothetical protein